MKIHIRKDDMVVVIAGNHRDLSTPRKVLSVIRDKQRLIVEGVNIVTKHTKPSAQNTEGGIKKMEAPIHVSNVMLWDAQAKKPSKIKKERDEKGKLKRILKKTNRAI